MPDYKTIRATNLVDQLRQAINSGTAGLIDVPLLVRQIIESGVWKKRTVAQTKETISFSSFREFAETSPPDGLGKSIKELEKLCAGDIEILDLLAGETQTLNRRGGDRRSASFKVNNVTVEKAERGNSSAYALRRLREQRPNLHRKVIEKQLSINQAMIAAGFRKSPIHLPADIKKIAEAIKKKLKWKQIEKLVKILQKGNI